MIDKSELQPIGIFHKTHALQGEINARIDIDQDFLSEGCPLIVEIEGIAVPFYIESWRPKGSTTVLIKLENVNFEMASEELVNQPIYALKRDLSEFYDMDEDDLITGDNLIGMEVYDEFNNFIGNVKELDTSTINELLIVEINDSEEQIFLPFVDDLIIEISPEQNKIKVQIPEGLLDLNKKTKTDNYE